MTLVVVRQYAVSKEGNFLKDLANKLDGFGASTSDLEAGRIMNAIQDKEEVFVKIEEEIDTVKNHIEESLKTMGAEFDPADDSFTFNGKRYTISLSQTGE